MLHGSGVRIFCRFLLCGGGAWLCPRSLWRRLLDFFRLRKKTRTRYNWAILREVHQSPGLIWAITAPQVRTLLALEVRLDVGFLDEAVDAVQKQAESREKAKHPVPHANPRVEQPEQPLVTELSVVVLQQEAVVPPLFEGRACCETHAGCVFYDGGAGGGKTPQILP